MGFADYFSRHPTSAAIPISKEDENFVINLIDSFKFMLKKADKISSNRNAENIPEQNDVIQTSERKEIKQNAFSRSLNAKQPHPQKSNIVNVCIRNKPHKNTFGQKIMKRFRIPNRKDIFIQRALKHPTR